MKKMNRFWLLCVVMLLSLSLCGCQRLDDMQARHAVWRKDGTILWNDAVYRQLPDVQADINTLGMVERIYVTAADVPVLLSEDFGTRFNRDKEGVFLSGRVSDGEEEYSTKRALFCRADHYKEIAAQLKEGFVPKGFCYDYFDSKAGENKTYYLNVEQEYALSHVMQTAPVMEFTDFSADVSTELYAYNEGDLHRQYSCQLIESFGTYYLVYRDWAYVVPADYSYQMESILAPLYETYNYPQDSGYYDKYIAFPTTATQVYYE